MRSSVDLLVGNRPREPPRVLGRSSREKQRLVTWRPFPQRPSVATYTNKWTAAELRAKLANPLEGLPFTFDLATISAWSGFL